MSDAVMMVCTWGNPTLRTEFGSIAFKKDEPRLVAPHMISFALERGIVPVDKEEKLFEDPKEEEPISHGSRLKAITEAIERIYERNNPDDFTTGATPKIAAVQKESKVPKVSSAEVKKILVERNERLEARAAADRKAKKEKSVAETEPPDDDEGR